MTAERVLLWPSPTWKSPVYPDTRRGTFDRGRFLRGLVEQAVAAPLCRLALSPNEAPLLFVRDEQGEAGVGLYLATLPPATLVLQRLACYLPRYGGRPPVATAPAPLRSPAGPADPAVLVPPPLAPEPDASPARRSDLVAAPTPVQWAEGSPLVTFDLRSVAEPFQPLVLALLTGATPDSPHLVPLVPVETRQADLGFWQDFDPAYWAKQHGLALSPLQEQTGRTMIDLFIACHRRSWRTWLQGLFRPTRTPPPATGSGEPQ